MFYKPHKKKIKHRQQKHFIDSFIYPLALIAPIMTVPQLLDVWTQGKVKEVSVATWGAYAIVSFMWVIYGLFHREKPIILTNLLLFILDSSIVLGVLFHK